MRTIEKAFIVPGFSISAESAEPFADALYKGEHLPRVLQPEILPASDLLADPRKYDKDLAENLVFAQSMGVMAVKRASGIIVMAGPERNTAWETIEGALGVNGADNSDAENKSGTEEKIVPQTTLETAKELKRHPWANAKGVWDIRNFSSAEHLINGRDNFPNLRLMFQFDHDEFGFTREPSVALVQQYGIHADILQGKHNEPFFRPENTLRQMAASLSAAGLQ